MSPQSEEEIKVKKIVMGQTYADWTTIRLGLASTRDKKRSDETVNGWKQADMTRHPSWPQWYWSRGTIDASLIWPGLARLGL